MQDKTSNHAPIPTELNIAPRGKSWLHGQLIDGEQGHPTRQSMESADRAQAIEAAPAQAAPAAVAAPAQALTGEARAEAIKRLAPIRAKLAAAASAVAVPDERAAFEVGILKYTPHAILDCHDGQYVIPWVQAAWTGWQARAALAATPTAAAPLPLLVRDIARELGITCTEACLALKPLGNFSTNTAVTAEMMAKLRECFPERVPASEVAGARERMTVGRACYFMERFLKEEKLLGPNEQAALHYVIDMLEAADAQVVLPEPWPTADDLAGAYEDAFKRKPAGQIWANLVVLVEALHARRALLAGVSAPAALAVERGEVLVTVSGFTGSGKSAIAGEIEIMCRALGLQVEWPDSDSEKRMTHADWIDALEQYKPRVRIVECNVPHSVVKGQDK